MRSARICSAISSAVIPPVGCQAFGRSFQTRCYIILDCRVAVTVNLKAVMIVRFDQWDDEKRFGVGMEVRGNISHANSPVGRAIVIKRLVKFLKRLAKSGVPFLLLMEQLPGVPARVEFHRVELVAEVYRVVRVQFRGAIEFIDRFGDLAGFFEHVGENVMSLCHRGSELDGTAPDASASSMRPRSSRAPARLTWASARFGSSSTARRRRPIRRLRGGPGGGGLWRDCSNRRPRWPQGGHAV